MATCFLKIMLLNFSHQHFRHSETMSLIAASVNRDVVCSVSWIRMEDTWTQVSPNYLYYI